MKNIFSYMLAIASLASSFATASAQENQANAQPKYSVYVIVNYRVIYGEQGDEFNITSQDGKLYVNNQLASFFSYDYICFSEDMLPQRPSADDGTEAEAVDLGLPSGNLWASHNVGATKPYELGGLFAWNDPEIRYVSIDKKQSATWKDGFSGYNWAKDEDDRKDVASAKWGNEWVTPSQADFEELFSETYQEWVSFYKGKPISGYVFFKIKQGANPSYNIYNDVHIFIPAAGQFTGSSTVIWANTWGYYWTSTDKYIPVAIEWDEQKNPTKFEDVYGANHVDFSASQVITDSQLYNELYNGRSVRPVKKTNAK